MPAMGRQKTKSEGQRKKIKPVQEQRKTKRKRESNGLDEVDLEAKKEKPTCFRKHPAQPQKKRKGVWDGKAGRINSLVGRGCKEE